MWWLSHTLYDLSIKNRTKYLDVHKISINYEENIIGNYSLDKKRSVILPATSIPYKVGAGSSYEIGKYAIIKTQTNYQYNIIQKRWEWFFGAGVSFTF